MTPSIESSLRAKLHRIIDEVFTATEEGRFAVGAGLAETQHNTAADAANAFLARLRGEELALVPQAESEPVIVMGDLMIDLAGHDVLANGRLIRLTHREFALLRHLAQRRGRACTREELVRHVWGDRELTSLRTVDIHVHRLRHKLGRPFVEWLETLRNVGYKLRTELRPKPERVHKGARSAAQMAVGERAPFVEMPSNLTADLGPSP